MNLRRLEFFVTLAQVGNLRRASEILNVSAPALSKAMQVLEEELDVKIWMRDGRNIILTDAGKILLRKSPQVISEFKDLKSMLSKNRFAPSKLRIGTFEVFSTYFLGLLEKLDWKNISLELHELLPGEVERQCIQSGVDIGVTYIPVPDPQLDFLKVCSIEMAIYCRKNSFPGVAVEDLPFVTPVMPLQGVPTKVRGLDGWPESGFQRQVQHQVTLMESAIELCRQGKVAGYFPVFVINEHNRRVQDEFRLERRKSVFPISQRRADVFIVKRKSTEESPAMKQIAAALRKIGQ